MFSFLIMELSFSFTDVKSIIILAVCSVNNYGLLLTINAALVRKDKFYAASGLKNDSCIYKS